MMFEKTWKSIKIPIIIIPRSYWELVSLAIIIIKKGKHSLSRKTDLKKINFELNFIIKKISLN